MREYDKAKKVLKSRRCKECGKEFTPEYGNKRRGFCSDICGSKYSNRVGKATRRARIANAPLVDNIDPIAVLSRDKWKCHICGRKTPKKLRGTIEDNAPEMDHIIPLARGGTHTWDNVACACRKCNSDKGDRIVGQLKLPTFVALGI
jgi:5-methylcytosine-specific restriction endonuclease McrA